MLVLIFRIILNGRYVSSRVQGCRNTFLQSGRSEFAYFFRQKDRATTSGLLEYPGRENGSKG